MFMMFVLRVCFSCIFFLEGEGINERWVCCIWVK